MLQNAKKVTHLKNNKPDINFYPSNKFGPLT